MASYTNVFKVCLNVFNKKKLKPANKFSFKTQHVNK